MRDLRARPWLVIVLVALLVSPAVATAEVAIRAYALPKGGGYPHDLAVSADGIVWYTAQRDGKLGRLDPRPARSSSCRSAMEPPRTA